MPDEYRSQLPYPGQTPGEDALWEALAELPLEDPGDGVRHRFHRELGRVRRGSFAGRLRDWLGLSGRPGWATAATCLLLGLLLGLLAGQFAGRALDDDGASGERLAALEMDVAELNRRLVLDRINNASAGKRLQGIIDAAWLVDEDPAITAALLERASGDRVASIRSAAIDALAPRMASPDVSRQLMALLEDADSPLVQFALVDLVLRYGDAGQLEQLRELARTERLHPELERYIDNSFGRERNET